MEKKAVGGRSHESQIVDMSKLTVQELLEEVQKECRPVRTPTKRALATIVGGGPCLQAQGLYPEGEDQWSDPLHYVR